MCENQLELFRNISQKLSMGLRIVRGAESGGTFCASGCPEYIVICTSVESSKVDGSPKLEVSR